MKLYAIIVGAGAILVMLTGTLNGTMFLLIAAWSYAMHLLYNRWLLTATTRAKHLMLGTLMFFGWGTGFAVIVNVSIARVEELPVFMAVTAGSLIGGHFLAGVPVKEEEYESLYFGQKMQHVLLRDEQQWFSDDVAPAGTLVPASGALVQPEPLRVRHTYVIGKTGKGKSNFLTHLILQDMLAGKGVGVLAPEADIFRSELLPRIPSDRLSDVIYFNPEDDDRPLIYNPFHLDEGEKLSLKAAETFAIFERTMSDLTGARMRPLLSNAIYALCEMPGATIVDLERILDPYESEFRQHIVETTKDERTRKFWRDTYTQFPPDATLPILNRLDDFLRPPVSTILGAGNPTVSLDFKAAMDEGKLLFFNLSTGLLGEKVSQLLGQLIVAKIQQTVWARESIPKDKRRPFYLYIDEFQTYTSTASASYSDILAKARKYGLALYLAHQQSQQIPTDLLADILGNVSTMVVLTTSMQDATRFGRELFLKDASELGKQPIGQGFARLDTDVHRIRIPLVTAPTNPQTAKAAMESSRANYGFDAVTPTKPPKPTPELVTEPLDEPDEPVIAAMKAAQTEDDEYLT